MTISQNAVPESGDVRRPQAGQMFANSGELITPLTPEGVRFRIDDIAHALAAMPRFAGQTNAFYSVAQHSIWCAEHAPPGLALQALLRDAPRAYLMDVLGPLKRRMPSYCAAESRLRHAILDSFGLDPHYSTARALNAVDDAALAFEWAHLRGDPDLSWWGIPGSAISQFEKPVAMPVDVARRQFIDAFHELVLRGEQQSQSLGHEKIDMFVNATQGWAPPNRPDVMTFSHERLDLSDSGPAALPYRLEDIALGLSRMPRFAGHTKFPYSVAQHCLMVASLVPPPQRLQALLHDGSEAYLMDMPSPIKGAFPEYKAVEARVEAAIYARFGVENPHEHKSVIKTADLIALSIECRDLMAHKNHANMATSERHHPPIRVMSSEEARATWIRAVNAELGQDQRRNIEPLASGLRGMN